MKTQAPVVTLLGTTLIVLFLANRGCEAAAHLSAAIAPQANTQANPMPSDTDKAKHLVLMEFPVLGAKHMPRLEPITDDPVKGAFPGYHFFVVGFMIWPVGHSPARGFGQRNLIVVTKDGKVVLLKQNRPRNHSKSLEKCLRDHARLVTDDESAKQAVEAWLRLSQEFTQDEYFQFTIPNNALTVEHVGSERTASGKLIVSHGGKGEIRAALVFTKDGKLADVDETNTVQAGERPICQATKLLDPDPIVRQMAEKAILMMGRAAKPYLDEERAKVSPALQKAIDRIWQRIIDEGW
jgi:hypothetical protein